MHAERFLRVASNNQTPWAVPASEAESLVGQTASRAGYLLSGMEQARLVPVSRQEAAGIRHPLPARDRQPSASTAYNHHRG